MTLWLAVFFGALQGITEFLPVSSSGHLVLFSNLFQVQADFVLFSVLLHLATLFSVVIVLWQEVKTIVLHPFCAVAKKLYVATIPTVVIVLLFKSFFEDAFSGSFLPSMFCLSAVILLCTELYSRKGKMQKIPFGTAFFVGVAQGFAVLPGLSRSGTTISALMLCGVDKKVATKFSFLLSIPIILASIAYELFGVLCGNVALLGVDAPVAIIAFATAFLTGVLTAKFMLSVFQKIPLWWFSIYLMVLGAVGFVIL